jgi:DNA-binding transcriptional LysR family regulator
MSDRIEALKLFVRTAQTGSFSRAARDRGLSQPVASGTSRER